MPWWGWLIVAVIIIFAVADIISSIHAANKAFDLNLRSKMQNDEEVFGRFVISDATTNSDYFYGCKYCKVSEFVYTGKFISGFHWRYQFEKSVKIVGVECKVLFWAGDDPREPSMYVTEEGATLLESNIGLRV